MNEGALTGTILVASGLRYMVQSVSLLKYLSVPAMMGPTPSPILSAHQLILRRPSKAFMERPPTTKERRPRDRLQKKDVTVLTLRALYRERPAMGTAAILES